MADAAFEPMPEAAAGRQGRSLPAHIAAGLAHAGGATDSAGQPWAGRQLAAEGNPLHRFEDDDGLADPAYSAVIGRFAAGDATEAEVVEALAPVRLFVPIVALLDSEAEGRDGLTADKQADMALVSLQAPDGRKALPAFSSAAALHAWHAQARPVAVHAARAALSAVSDGAELLVLDPGNDVTLVLRRPAVWALARGQRWTPSYQDPDLVDIVSRAAVGEGHLRGIRLEAGSGVASRTADGRVLAGGGAGPELRITLELAAGLDRDIVAGVVEQLQSRLSADREFAERVDSLELRIEAAPPAAGTAGR